MWTLTNPQNILEIKNEFISAYECEDDELTGSILPLVLVAVIGTHNRDIWNFHPIIISFHVV